ncbi:hypothetical protein PENNAL_c0124G08506, partial [Penicillium nalgiovense]
MPPPQQPIQLIYCTASVCIPKRKREHPRRRRRDSNITEEIRQGTSARATALCRLFVPGPPEHHTLGAAIATVKHTCWEFYRRIGDKTKASLRRVLHRVLRLDLTAFTPRTTEYGLVTRLWPSEFPGAPSVASKKRQPEKTIVILIILDSHLTSFDLWQLDRHGDELMFQSGSWRTSPTFADEQA